MLASEFSGHCDVISNRLWRHQPNVNRASETRGRCVKIVALTSFLDSLCLRNEILYILSWRTVYALRECYFGVYLPCWFVTREMNTKITLSWAHKQFATRVQSLFYICSCNTCFHTDGSGTTKQCTIFALFQHFMLDKTAYDAQWFWWNPTLVRWHLCLVIHQYQ